jgi:mannose/fructose/N-acetylgalactosamine-specific phosphotransferase system component IIC
VNYGLLGTFLLGGIAALDATPVAQTLLSQPLVTATVLGALWGNLELALQVGVVLQILAASTLPVGARTPEDYAVGGVVGTGTALALGSQQSFEVAQHASAMLGVIAGLITAVLGVPLLKWQRRRNEGLSRWCEEALRQGDEGALAAAQRAGVVLAFATGVAATAVMVGVAVRAFQGLAAHESLRLARAWSLAQPLWIGLGLAQLLHAFVQRRLTRAALFGLALLAGWLVLMVGTP